MYYDSPFFVTFSSGTPAKKTKGLFLLSLNHIKTSAYFMLKSSCAGKIKQRLNDILISFKRKLQDNESTFSSSTTCIFKALKLFA